MPSSTGEARFLRSARLTSQKEFQRVFRAAVKSGNSCFTVLAAKNGLNYPRLGLAISKKCARSAVARNRVKRVVRESFRHHQRRLAGLDIVVLGRHGIAAKDKREMHASLTKHWSRLVKRCARY